MTELQLSWFSFQTKMTIFEHTYVPAMNVCQQNRVNGCLWGYCKQGIDVDVGETIKMFYPWFDCMSIYLSAIIEDEVVPQRRVTRRIVDDEDEEHAPHVDDDEEHAPHVDDDEEHVVYVDDESDEEHAPHRVTIVDDDESDEEHAPHVDDNESDVEEYEVEKVLKCRHTSDGGCEYLIKWLGYSSDENSWVKEADLHCPLRLLEYMQSIFNHSTGYSIVDVSAD